MHLVRALPDLVTNEKAYRLAHSEIVTVSTQDCDICLDQIYAQINKNRKANKGGKHVVINYGVAASRQDLCLEVIGKNIKDFRIPDERGN